MNEDKSHLSAAHLRPHLINCGYSESQLIAGLKTAGDHQIPLAAFAHFPHDSRSACIAAIDSFSDPEADVIACRGLGAPVVFTCRSDEMLFWKQGADKPKFVRRILPSELNQFFEKYRDNLSPQSVYRAKTWARFDKHYQLNFVDVGLMPMVEEEAGQRLTDLIERVVVEARLRLGWKEISEEQGQWLLKSNFWLLAAKILKDKNVPGFITLDLENVANVFSRVAKHYDSDAPASIGSKEQAAVLQDSAREISRFSSLNLVSTEALAYLYERALITKVTRTELGTHSTPAYLVDYIVGKLGPWIEEMDIQGRQVFEPACGHAAFLLAAMRALRESPSVDSYPPLQRHKYLRDRLHGNDTDAFALEIARLSLTLADVPNPNGWDLKPLNMFDGDFLAKHSRKANIILANPPFGDFSKDERQTLAAKSAATEQVNKSAEMLWRVVTNMQPGAVFGVVLPQNILHSKSAVPLRRFIAENFEISEISVFPDKVFTFSDSESAVILGRRAPQERQKKNTILYRRIRESEMASFRQSYKTTQDYKIQSSRFSAKEDWSFFVPDLEQVWEFCHALPKFNDIAEIGQGFQFRSKTDPLFPEGATTKSPTWFDGSVSGFARLRESLQTHQQPDSVWVNLAQAVIGRPRHGTTTGIPQVLLNYAPVSRDKWRLKAFLDQEGHPVMSRFLVIRPRTKTWPLEALWGICNSPFANAYAYAYSTKRDLTAGVMRRMPIPDIRSKSLAPLSKAVRAYLQAAQSSEVSQSSFDQSEELKTLHWRIDEEVLRLYELPVALERQILDVFAGEERLGVPFQQHEYFPKELSSLSTLRELLNVTIDWDQANDRRIQLITKKAKEALSPEERAELNKLQELADQRIKLVAPLPILQMERVKEDLKRRGMWEGS